MCYDVQLLKGKLKKLEQRYGKVDIANEVQELPLRVSGFGNAKLPVITQQSPHLLQALYWGFVPAFAKDAKQAAIWKNRSLNCRADTLRTKLAEGQNSMFKQSVNKPCVILVSGFFEWHTLPDGKTKVPYYIALKDGETFPIAGLTSTWKDLGDPNRTHTGTTLCTTAANRLLGFIHNQPKGSEDYRMPAILLPEEVSTWLDTSLSPDDRLSIIKSYPQEEMEAYTVANFKKKDFRLVDDGDPLQPFDYALPAVPTHLDGGNVV